jgi:hypothetical protein
LLSGLELGILLLLRQQTIFISYKAALLNVDFFEEEAGLHLHICPSLRSLLTFAGLASLLLKGAYAIAEMVLAPPFISIKLMIFACSAPHSGLCTPASAPYSYGTGIN